LLHIAIYRCKYILEDVCQLLDIIIGHIPGG